MTDPLSILRQYTLLGKSGVENGDNITFGEVTWPKNVKTNYIVYGSGKNGTPKEYYTLECLVLMLKYFQLSYSVYIRRAAVDNIPVVTRLDRKDILSYLKGNSSMSKSIDKCSTLEVRATKESAAFLKKNAGIDNRLLQRKELTCNGTQGTAFTVTYNVTNSPELTKTPIKDASPNTSEYLSVGEIKRITMECKTKVNKSKCSSKFKTPKYVDSSSDSDSDFQSKTHNSMAKEPHKASPSVEPYPTENLDCV